MLWVLGQPFHRKAKQVDTVAGRKIELEAVGGLQKLDGHRQHVRFGEWQMVLQNGHLIPLARKAKLQRRLETAEDVVGDFVGRFVLVHRDSACLLYTSPS